MMTSAVIGALRINLGIDTAAFSAGLNQAQKQLARASKQVQQIGRTLSTNVAAPLALLGTGVLKTAADFEQGMANVKAILAPTASEFQRLSALAEELGRTTKFTAREAADGMEMLARNGIDAANILGGATDATLKLAAAAGSQLAPAADAITDIMVNFRKSAAELGPVIDQISGTLVNSKLSWDDYRLALGQAGGAAGPLGMSFEDMNAALAATAASFSSGVEAGTSLKGFLLRLAPSSKQAKDTMAALGLQFFDAAGNMRSLAEIAQNLRDRLGGLTKQAQTEVLGSLFGQRTIRTALRLMEEGAEGIDRFRAKIAEGNAEQMAASRMDNLYGSLNLLRAALEGVAISIGRSGLLEWARSAADTLTGVAASISELHPALLRFGTVFAGLTAIVGPALLALGLFGSALAALSLPITGTVAALAAVSAAVALWGRDLEQVGNTISVIFEDIYNTARTWLTDKLGGVIDGVSALFEKIASAFRWFAQKIGLDAELAAAAQRIRNEFSATSQRVANDVEMLKNIGASAADYVGDAWARAGARMESVAEHARGTWSRMAEAMVAGLPPTFAPKAVPLSGADTFDTSELDDVNRLARKLKSDAESARDALLAEGRRVFEETRTPAEALRLEFERLNDLVRSGAIGFDTFTRAVANAQNEFSGLTDAAESVSQSFGSALEGMIVDGKNWRDSLAGFLKDIAREILRVAALAPLMNAIKGGITGAFGGGGGFAGLIAGLPGFANGGSFKVGGVGGIDSQLVAFKASPNERVTIDKPGQERGGVVVSITNHNDYRGVDPSMRAWIESRQEITKQQAVSEAVAAVAKTRSNNPRYLQGF